MKAASDAWSIIDEATPQELLSVRAAAMPVVLRELLDIEVQMEY